MNDPKDIVVTITLEKEDNISIDQTIIEEKKENIILSDETRFNNLYLHLKENLSKRLYKKTIKEIDVLVENKYIEGYSQVWKISILKIQALLKIVKNKIIKYLINHYEKSKIKAHINSIKKYFNQILKEFNKFFQNNKESKIINDNEIVDSLMICYFDYIYYISFFHKKIGNMIESITYLSLVLKLYKETKLIAKSMRTIHKIEKCFIFLAQIFIYNEDYVSCIEYLNLAMDLCLKNIIYQTNDLLEGLFKGNKNQLNFNLNINNDAFNKNKIESELESEFGDKKLKKILINIIMIYLYRGVCYENMGKIKNSIRSYYQSKWFLEHFFLNSNKNFLNLIKNILDKSLNFKITIDYLDKKIKYFEHIQLKLKNQAKKDNKNKKNNLGNNLYSKKFKGLINKIDNLKIYEIDTVNKFENKKNIKIPNSVKREAKDKNIFLSDLRLLNAYLREDFRVMIDKMNKIKTYDMDYQTREKIQKLIRKIYFEQNQKKIRLKQKNKNMNNLLISSKSFKAYNNKKNIRNNRYEVVKNRSQNSDKKNIRAKSAFFLDKNKILFPSKSYISLNKNQSINFKILDITNQNSKREINNKDNLRKTKSIRLNSACLSRKMKIYEENKELNKFFNKKYILKRNYIKKLENRELIFQKSILRLKNTPKDPIPLYNKEIIKNMAKEFYNKKLSLLIGTPINWRENLSEEEVKNLKIHDKLQEIVFKSLNNSALTKYQEENKRKIKKIISSDETNISEKNIDIYNKKIIEKINLGIEELRQREIIENKNFQKLLKENMKNLCNRNDKSLYISNSCIICSNSRNNNYFRKNLLKKSYSSPYLN